MNNTTPFLIEDVNLSYAWGRIVLHILENPGKEISPLIVSITSATEDAALREIVDNSLDSIGEQKINTVANTIFPASLWRRCGNNRNRLFERYIDIFPRIQKASISKNKFGIYFERLIRFSDANNNVSQLEYNGNQLEYIINQFISRKRVRKSMFQASIFDPERDHNPSAQIPFPCLQHISFIPLNGDLILNAFYATQKIFIKAYGNYLGLYRLGEFMAHEMGLNFVRLNCFIGVAKMDGIPKGSPQISQISDFLRSLTEE